MSQKAVLVNVSGDKDGERVLKELEALADTAGYTVEASLVQRKSMPDRRYYIGSGKLEELKNVVMATESEVVIFDNDLTGSQFHNLETYLGVTVIDRATLIIEIFAAHARSNEGKLQVELAQLKYLYPRLKGKGEALSRLGGGIGTRGPGETQLETDRRKIRTRINSIENRLKTLQNQRNLINARRKKNEIPSISLIGYTNTGKSTLLNALTDSDVYTENRLFATLDPTSRKFSIDSQTFILTDTVGFLRDLPHSIISAFRSTLESALFCDLALIVCDCLTSFDGFPAESIFISAKKKLGLDGLKKAILRHFQEKYADVDLFIPYARLQEYNMIKRFLFEMDFSYQDTGVQIAVRIPNRYLNKISSFILH